MTIFTTQSALDPLLIMKQIDAEFEKIAASGAGGSGGGISEAPIDQNLYSRGQGTWVETGSLQVSQPIVDAPSAPGISEAPTDGKLYGRENAAWVQVPAAVPGPVGPMGQRGSLWTTGSGPPSGGSAQAGDMYLDTATGDVYKWD